MDRVHDYESCDIGSIPSMGIYFWRGGRVWIIAPVLKTGNRQ